MIDRIETKGKALTPERARDAAYHWRRFRRLMAFTLAIAVVAVTGSLWLLHRQGTVLHLQFMIAMGLGIGVSLLLAGALMGLVFLSSNSGHDEAVTDPLPPADVQP